MKTTTRKLLTRIATGVAIAATAAVMFLPATASAQSGGGLSFGFSINPDGKPSVSIGVGEQPPGRHRNAEVCFYSRTNYRGSSFCMDENTSIRDLRDWTDDIGSFDNPDGLRVTLCTRTSYRGQCRTYTTGARNVGFFDGNVASIRIR